MDEIFGWIKAAICFDIARVFCQDATTMHPIHPRKVGTFCSLYPSAVKGGMKEMDTVRTTGAQTPGPKVEKRPQNVQGSVAHFKF